MADAIDEQLAEYLALKDTIRGKTPLAAGRTWRRRLSAAVGKGIEHVEVHPLQDLGMLVAGVVVLAFPCLAIYFSGDMLAFFVDATKPLAIDLPMDGVMAGIVSLMKRIGPLVGSILMLVYLIEMFLRK